MRYNSIWESETFYRKRDIIIIGAGFTGLWTALSIREKFPQKTVLVTERASVPKGASTRNAGFACFGSLTEIIADSEKMGWEKTLELVRMRFEGLGKIQQYFKHDEIDFDLCGGYEILNDGTALEKIDDVNRRLRTITGLDQTYFLSPDKIAEFGLAHTKFLVENPLEGSLHSGKLLQKLIERCHDAGVEFLFGSEVIDIQETEESVKVLGRDFQIESHRLVIATNAFAPDLVPDLDLVPARGQILLTGPVHNLKLKGTFHFDEGFYYFRNIGNRVLLGGARNLDFENEQTAELDTTGLVQNHLETFLKEVILPAEIYSDRNFRILGRWSGIMAMGSEKAPIVQRITDRQVCAVRLSGMGVALAPKIGEMVAEMV